MTDRQMQQMSQRYFAMPPKLNPEEGITVFEPEGDKYGFWVGGHNVVFDPKEKKFFLYYRVRSPLGKGRGAKCRIAESADGIHFANIWEGSKEELNANSIEVASIIRDPITGRWRLYISYEDSVIGTWRIDLVEADHPKNFDLLHHRTVIDGGTFGLRSVKDPKIYIIGGLYHAFVITGAENPYREDSEGTRHARGGGDRTGLMTSEDGIYWRDLKFIFEPGKGSQGEWGHYRARITSILWIEPLWVGFFDGGESSYDNYEEWCGVALSHDLEHWRRLSRNGPWVRSPYGCIRYMDALRVGNEIFYYYEYTRKNGSHELRMNKVGL